MNFLDIQRDPCSAAALAYGSLCAHCEYATILQDSKFVFIHSMDSYGAFLITAPYPPSSSTQEKKRYDAPALLIYMKASRQVLKKAFPMSYSEVKRIKGKTYVVGLFAGKIDFVGQDDWQSISKLINGSPSVNILKASYTQARGTFNQLSESDYEADKIFATRQLEDAEGYLSGESPKAIKSLPKGNTMLLVLAMLTVAGAYAVSRADTRSQPV